ncbi:MAG: carbohydrate kinase family protein [Acidobacteriaceae bacterium]
MKFILFGETNLDIILRGYGSYPTPGREVLVDDLLLTLGSSCAITGAGLAKLGDSVAYLSRPGDDYVGRLCLDRMIELGMDVSRVKLDPRLKTGVTVSITSHRDRSLVSYLGATTALTIQDFSKDTFSPFQHVHSSSYFLQTGLHPGFEDVFARAKREGLTTSLDPACDPADRWKSNLDRVLRYVDVFLPNESELAGITGEQDALAALRALKSETTLTVAKLGSRGAMALQNGEPVCVSAPRIIPVDTTGAGDNFNAGFLHAWTQGRTLVDALRLGVACGSLSTQELGGTGVQPTEDQAERFLQSFTGAEAQ